MPGSSQRIAHRQSSYHGDDEPPRLPSPFGNDQSDKPGSRDVSYNIASRRPHDDGDSTGEHGENGHAYSAQSHIDDHTDSTPNRAHKAAGNKHRRGGQIDGNRSIGMAIWDKMAVSAANKGAKVIFWVEGFHLHVYCLLNCQLFYFLVYN